MSRLPDAMKCSARKAWFDVPRYIVMLAPSHRTKGGIAAVVDQYRRAGLFTRWPVLWLGTHADGSRWRKLRVASATFIRFLGLLLAGRVALVHVHSASNASFWRKSIFILAAKLARRPVVFHLHGGGFMEFIERWRGKWAHRYIRFVLDKIDDLVVLSPVWRRQLCNALGERRITVIGNPVDAQDYLADSVAGRSAHTVLFMGRLDPDKGIFDLVQCLPAVRAAIPSVSFVFAGTGDSDGVRRCAAECGVDDAIVLTGWVSGDAKRRLMREAAVFVLPSYIECMPVGLLEAMASGTAVLATSVGGVPDIVEPEVDGLLVAPGDRAALTDSLIRLLADSALRARLGQAAKQKVIAHYTTERILPQIEAIYRKYGVHER